MLQSRDNSYSIPTTDFFLITDSLFFFKNTQTAQISDGWKLPDNRKFAPCLHIRYSGYFYSSIVMETYQESYFLRGFLDCILTFHVQKGERRYWKIFFRRVWYFEIELMNYLNVYNHHIQNIFTRPYFVFLLLSRTCIWLIT